MRWLAHVPGVLGDEHAAERDSYANGLLEGPHYTRPDDFRGWRVPEALRTGHAGHVNAGGASKPFVARGRDGRNCCYRLI